MEVMERGGEEDEISATVPARGYPIGGGEEEGERGRDINITFREAGPDPEEKGRVWEHALEYLIRGRFTQGSGVWARIGQMTTTQELHAALRSEWGGGHPAAARH